MLSTQNRKISLLILVVLALACGCGISIYDAAYEGDLDDVTAAVGQDPSLVNSRFPDGSTPLLMAVYGGHLEVVKYLVSRGADINAFDTTYRYTPLHAAAYVDNTDIAEYLVSKGADVDVKTAAGETPLYLAANSGNVDLVKTLISYGADVGAKSSDGKTPLAVAEEAGNQPLIAALKYTERATRSSFRFETRDRSQMNGQAKTFPPSEAGMGSDFAELAATLSDADFGRYHALVIGNGSYQFLPPLETARNDAEAVAGVLRTNYGFRIKLLLDATRSDILIALEEYRRNLTSNDNLLIYYAGHGWLDEAGDEGYWLPIDAAIDNPVNWLSNASITTSIKALAAKHVLIVSDSCYSGKLGRGVHIVQRTRDYYSKIVGKKARSVLASGGLEPVVDRGGEGNHSVFAAAFISALDENTGIMDCTLLFTKIRGPVMLNSDQTPEYSDIRKAGHEGGDFIFIRRGE